MELISREDLLKVVGADDVYTPDEMWKPAREWLEIIKAMPTVENKSKGEWIPIKFREATAEEIAEHETDIVYDCKLPDDGDEVLVTLSYRNCVTMTEFYHDGEYCGFEDYDHDDVIAWRPLPEPYIRGEK